MRVRACMCVCMRACVHVRVRACVHNVVEEDMESLITSISMRYKLILLMGFGVIFKHK